MNRLGPEKIKALDCEVFNAWAISGFFLRAKQILTKQKARYGEQTHNPVFARRNGNATQIGL